MIVLEDPSRSLRQNRAEPTAKATATATATRTKNTSRHPSKERTPSSNESPRIAIISSYVPSSQWNNKKNNKKGNETTSTTTKRLDTDSLDMLVNKACYSYRNNYEFIFNMTHGFDSGRDNLQGQAYWQEYGTWSRVPHIQDRWSDFDWVLYADSDWVVLHHSRPLEAFMDEWKSQHNHHPSIYVPRDFAGARFSFSAFAVLIRNSHFGRAVIHNWMKFARGLCPKGNLSPEPRKYTWEDSDQPGIWYALMQTHMDFNKNKMHRNGSNTSDMNKMNLSALLDLSFLQKNRSFCDPQTGLIATKRALGPEFNYYMSNIANAQPGDSGMDLARISKDQPILWSQRSIHTSSGPYGGLGVQTKFSFPVTQMHVLQNAFAAHVPPKIWKLLPHTSDEECIRDYGCYANYTEDGRLRIGCGDKEFTVSQPSYKEPATEKQ